MSQYEYKVVPAPTKGTRAKGAKSVEARFAVALADVMNELGADGWEYQRSDTLPCEVRSGFRGKNTVFQNMLVFRRKIAAEETTDAAQPVVAKAVAPKPKSEPAREIAVKAPSAHAAADIGEAPKLGPANADAETSASAPKIDSSDVAAQ